MKAEATGTIRKTDSPIMKKTEVQPRSVCIPVIGPITGRSIVSGESHQMICRNRT